MFIYKITNLENNLCYIGFDTHTEYRQARWKAHQKNCLIQDTKFYIALRENREKFNYEIIDHADKIIDLAFKEIYWIDHYNSYKKGYNSTRGGDGLNQDLSQFAEEEIFQLKQLYSFTMAEYNHNIKWKDKTPNERKDLTSHLHNEEIYKKKSESLKIFYEANPEFKKEKGKIIKKYWESLNLEDRELRCETNKSNSLLGSMKVSKKIKIEFQNGTTKIYNSKSEFNREHGEIINAILRKTKEGKSHRNFKGWEINDQSI
jgi:hypothetical protein